MSMLIIYQVQNQANMASSEKVDTGEHILIHHSRNTAQKQWAETQVFLIIQIIFKLKIIY